MQRIQMPRRKHKKRRCEFWQMYTTPLACTKSSGGLRNQRNTSANTESHITASSSANPKEKIKLFRMCIMICLDCWWICLRTLSISIRRLPEILLKQLAKYATLRVLLVLLVVFMDITVDYRQLVSTQQVSSIK